MTLGLQEMAFVLMGIGIIWLFIERYSPFFANIAYFAIGLITFSLASTIQEQSISVMIFLATLLKMFFDIWSWQTEKKRVVNRRKMYRW